jgi:hypothetical protein
VYCPYYKGTIEHGGGSSNSSSSSGSSSSGVPVRLDSIDEEIDRSVWEVGMDVPYWGLSCYGQGC